MAGSDRAINVLKLFTLDTPEWTVEAAAGALLVSVSSAYRYFSALTQSGLLTRTTGGRYVLGPAIIQYDRQIQLTDPLLRAAKPVMAGMTRHAPDGSIVLLCRVFRDTVLGVHQDGGAGAAVSYERGRPMPLFLGATSKIILAHLPPRDLRRLCEKHQPAIAAAGLGENWAAFRKTMTAMRKAGHVVTRAELDAGRIGIAAPILDAQGRVLGSLSYVIDDRHGPAAAGLAARADTGARTIEAALR